MSCNSCGTGKHNGCKNNGGCLSGSCNRLNAYDWLQNLPMPDFDSTCKIVELGFHHGSRKAYCRHVSLAPLDYYKGDLLTIEGVNGGYDIGEVLLTGELVLLQLKKHKIETTSTDIKKILHKSTDKEIELWNKLKNEEQQILLRARLIANELKLDMKISEVEMQGDGKRGTFFYTADDRVDFRELIKRYAITFSFKIEMKQINMRQEAGKIGGIGMCGRELCCSTWLPGFKNIQTQAAKYQELSINQAKLSGQCGRLKCCLNYELDTYIDALQEFPNDIDILEFAVGTMQLVKKDIFKKILWYRSKNENNRIYIYSLDKVIAIKQMNSRGEKAIDIEEEEQKQKIKIEDTFIDAVGQISLRSLERADRKRKKQYQHVRKQ